MWCLIQVAFLLSGAIFALFLLILSPYPAGTKRVLARSLNNLRYEIITIVSRAGARLGMDTELNIKRRIQDFLTERANAAIDNTKVRINNTKLGGVEVRIYRPMRHTSQLPGMIYYHGGGWVFSTTKTYDVFCAMVATELPAVVVSVNYRRAPEYPYPAAFEDCVAASRALMKTAEGFGIDKDRIGISGHSAGGNLAAAVGLKLTSDADPSLPTLKYEILIYPALQALDFNTPSYMKYAKGPCRLYKDLMIFFWLSYMKGNHKQLQEFAHNRHFTSEIATPAHASYVDYSGLPWFKSPTKPLKHTNSGPENKFMALKDVILDPYFAPLMASDVALKRLPPTYMINCELDVLRDDGFLYVKRLKSVGTEVVHDYVAGEEHLFMQFIKGNPVAEKSYCKMLDFIKRKLEQTN